METVDTFCKIILTHNKFLKLLIFLFKCDYILDEMQRSLISFLIKFILKLLWVHQQFTLYMKMEPLYNLIFFFNSKTIFWWSNIKICYPEVRFSVYKNSFILRDEGCVTLWFSKERLWTSSISITWELTRNADFQAAPQTHWIRIVGCSPEVYGPTSPPGDSAVAKAEEPLHRGCLVEGLCNGKGACFESVLSVVLSKTIGDLLIPLV